MKEEARTAILNAAEQVLAEQGIHAARMDDIAARVGVSVGTLYNYFEDRKQLMAALLDVRGRELRDMLDTELERSQGAPFRVRMHGFLRCILEHSRTHFQLFTLSLEDVLEHGISSGEDVSRERTQSLELTRRIEHLTRQGVEEGALRPEDTRHYPTLLLSMLRGVLVRQFLEKQPVPVDELISLLLRCFLDGAAPRPR